MNKSAVLPRTVAPVRVSAKPGSVILLDGPPSYNYKALEDCTYWDKADFLWPVGFDGPIKAVAVNIFVTGRTIQFKHGDPVVRVKVEFVGDGEASRYVPGWILLNTALQEDA